MREDAMRDALDAFSIQEYIEKTRVRGRRRVDKKIRRQAAELYGEIRAFRSMEKRLISAELDAELELAERTLFPEFFFANNEEPRYPAYGNIAVLDWVLGKTKRAPLDEVTNQSWLAVRVLLQDLLSFEIRSLAGQEAWCGRHFKRRIVSKRVEELKKIPTAVGQFPPQHAVAAASDEIPDRFRDFIADKTKTLALRHLTAFPQSSEHDEYLFLRTIHISECCFLGVSGSVSQAIEKAKKGNLDEGASFLSEATSFAHLLTPLFRAFKTMPPEHFLAFRLDTGDASAIQSESYQFMQIITQGVDEQKILALDENPDLRGMLNLNHGGFLHLCTLVRKSEREDWPERETFVSQAKILDDALYMWRAIHLGIARGYLPPETEGTGNTSGASYLARSYAQRIITDAQTYRAQTPHRALSARFKHPFLSRMN